MGEAYVAVDSKTEEEISTTVKEGKEGAKRKQRIKVKQKSKQTPQRAAVVTINWLLKHPRELGDFQNELQWRWIDDGNCSFWLITHGNRKFVEKEDNYRRIFQLRC
jgi:hypothetical protein